jgi:hypothetical protein
LTIAISYSKVYISIKNEKNKKIIFLIFKKKQTPELGKEQKKKRKKEKEKEKWKKPFTYPWVDLVL